MELYKIPKILIIHLKRFRQGGRVSSYGYGYRSRGGGKIDKVIDFPIENLDMSKYVLNPTLPSDYTKP